MSNQRSIQTVSKSVSEPRIDVSVIVAVRNGAATIGQCIDSVLSQEGCSVELIIVDAMSDDRTEEIVAAYGNRVATYIREPDRGISDAWNKALVIARGGWCLFLGADDYFLHSGALRALLSGTKGSATPPVIVVGAVQMVAENQEFILRPPSRNLASRVRLGRMLPHQAMLTNVDALRSAGGFDSSLVVAGDFDATLKMLSMGECVVDSGVHTAMRSGGLSSSADRRLRLQSENELARVIAQRSGFLVSRLVLAKLRSRRLAGIMVEKLLLSILGDRRGSHTTLRLRRMLALRERLHSKK